ncbi:MAG: class I SAM-dependent methyltransferase [Terracidiphilus sp.]
MDWKEQVYASYVSSGQAHIDLGPQRKYLSRVIRRHFPKDRKVKILDIGCGNGPLLWFLSQHGYRNLRGVDGSMEQVNLAKELGVPGVEWGNGLTVLQQASSTSIDVICLFDVLEHLTRQECFDLLSEVHRVLTPNGLCIGHVPNAEGIFGSRIRYGDLSHEQAFTERSIGQMFRCLKFSEVKSWEDTPVFAGLSTVRRVLWTLGTAPIRLLFAAETGRFHVLLSQNLLFVAHR